LTWTHPIAAQELFPADYIKFISFLLLWSPWSLQYAGTGLSYGSRRAGRAHCQATGDTSKLCICSPQGLGYRTGHLPVPATPKAVRGQNNSSNPPPCTSFEQ
jgi:hypothetical protein